MPQAASQAPATPTSEPRDRLLHAWQQLLAEVHADLHALGAHPARSVVLLPYAQLLPLAARLWAAQFPDGFAPRFETTRTWAAREGCFASGPHDVSQDRGRDLLTAFSLLEGAGLRAQRRLLAGPLVDQAAQLAQVAASLPSTLRPDWMERTMRTALPQVEAGSPLALEAALSRIALAWAGGSDYASDVLFVPRVGNALDALLIVPGLLPDELTRSLADHYVEKVVHLQPWLNLKPADPPHPPALHACTDAEDEATRAAACVLQHLHAGRTPVALASGDRLLLRRVSALLATRGVRPGVELHDETGWTLSTTHAAAGVLAALHACAPQAGSDEVLDWLKLAPAFDPIAQRALERQLRQHAVRHWAHAALMTAELPLTQQIEALRAAMAEPRPWRDWLPATRALLQGCGLWAVLEEDAAGQSLIAALGLDDDAPEWPAAKRRMSLSEFTHWAADALEAASFRPPAPAGREPLVVVLPLNQLLGRPFAALVLPGADAQHLPLAPDLSGPWTLAQREALHLPGREALKQAQAAAWDLRHGVPAVDVLWRQMDDSGEPLLPSPFVQLLQLPPLPADDAPPAAAQTAAAWRPGQDGRVPRPLGPSPVARPAPQGHQLPAQPLSASGYDMLRACPYRFFALRQLGLQSEGELDVELSKRDWGNWLHDTLQRFHTALKAKPRADRCALIDQAAEQATQAMGAALEPGEFLPFMAGWPDLRDAYLNWLAGHEQGTGARFEAAEQAHPLVHCGEVQLRGQIDRIDRLPGGAPLLIDYKTESAQRTKERIQAGTEDTQLPFYALLAGHNEPRAAYLNLSGPDSIALHELPDLQTLAERLYEGMRSDMHRIAQGAPLPALGEGQVCDWCDARGLCRKDWWGQTPAQADE